MATNQPNIELLRLNKDTAAVKAENLEETKVAAATNVPPHVRARARSVPISKQATSKASQKQKSTNAKCTHKATNFRQCSNPDIDLEHRKKMRHSNKLLSPEEIEKEQISNPLVQALLQAQWNYWNRSEIKDIKTLDGKELYRNYLSLPLGLDKDATCVIEILHYLTLEETSKLSDGESCFTATWSDGTLKCNTPEFARHLFGDKYYHQLVFIDVVPVAIRYETALEQLVGKKNAGVMLAAYFEDVLSILLKEENILLAFAAGSSFELFAKLMERTWKENFGEYYRSHPGKIISASEDPNVYVAPPHPCSCYQPGKQSNMETKLWRCDSFSTSVRRALDPSASPSEFGKEFWSTNSEVFRFLQLAALEGSSHGGQMCWKLMKEAVERYDAGIEPLDDDEKRVQHYLDFMQQSWDTQTISNELARAKKAAGTKFDTDAFLEELREKHPDKGDAINFVSDGEKHRSDVKTISDELARAKKEGGTEFDTNAFLEELREKDPDKGGAINFVAGGVRAYNSVLSKRKGMLTSVITSVEKAAKARSVEECKIDCSIYKCIECSEKRSEEYSEFHYAVSADLGKDKLVTCLLCKKQEFISINFRREGSILFKDVLDERLKLVELSKKEKKKSAPKRKKKSAPKRKVEAATSSTSKKRKLSDGANSERLADAGGPDDDESCSDCSYHPGTGKWKLRIRNGKLMGADFHPYKANPAATAALQAVLASAQDGDGVVDPDCLQKALSKGFSKAFIDAKVDEQEALNVKPKN